MLIHKLLLLYVLVYTQLQYDRLFE
jgi:hypothetical protein